MSSFSATVITQDRSEKGVPNSSAARLRAHHMPIEGALMAIRRFLKLALVALAPLLIGVTTASGRPGNEIPDLNSLSDEDLRTVTVLLERTKCYGICPAYRLTIHGDGRVEYEGRDYVKEKGTREGHLDTDRVKALISEFAGANFVALSEGYSEAKCSRYCTDMPTAVTELSVRGVTHRVRHYYGCGGAPKALFDLESAVDKAANVEQWTGDVSKAGPFGTTCSNRN